MRRTLIATALCFCVSGAAIAQQQTPPGKAAAEDGASGQQPGRPVGQPGRTIVQPGQQGGQVVQPGANPNRVTGAQGVVGQNAQGMSKEQTLATCVAIDNQTEIAIVKMAKDKLQHEKVQEFADMMIKDHQAFLTKLNKFAPEATGDANWLNSSESPDDRTTQAKDRDDRTVANSAQPQASGRQTTAFRGDMNANVDFLQIHREVARECLQSAREGLKEKNESEVDACFVGWQIASHGMMKNKLTVLERHATGELAEVLAEGRKTTEKHMEHALELMKDLDKDRHEKDSK